MNNGIVFATDQAAANRSPSCTVPRPGASFSLKLACFLAEGFDPRSFCSPLLIPFRFSVVQGRFFSARFGRGVLFRFQGPSSTSKMKAGRAAPRDCRRIGRQRAAEPERRQVPLDRALGFAPTIPRCRREVTSRANDVASPKGHRHSGSARRTNDETGLLSERDLELANAAEHPVLSDVDTGWLEKRR